MGNIKIYLVVALIAFAGGYMMQPEPEVKIHEVVKIKRDIHTVIIEQPDGTKITRIVEKDRSERELKVSKKSPKKDWILGVGRHIQKEVFHVSISRRVLGDIYIQGQVDQQGQVVLGVEVLF